MEGAKTVIDIVAEVTDNTAVGAKSAEKNVSKLETSVKKLRKTMQGMQGKTKIELKASLKDMATKGIAKIISSGKQIAGKVWNVTVKATDLATAPLKKLWDIAKNPVTQMVAVTGVSVGAADTMNTYKSFEQGMANVKAISGATDAEFKALTEQAKELGESTQFSASEAASAMENLAMAGWKTDAIISGMPGLLDLAAAGSVDLATASDVVASGLAQFGYGAEESTRVADVLAATASNSKTDVQGLGESLKYAGSLAGALGYDIEDVALAFGLMGNSAIDASSAGTALRGLLSRMAKQGELTEEESNAVSDAMKKVGVSMTDSKGKTKSLMTVMQELRTGFSRLSESEKTEVAANLAGQNAMSGLLAIVNASDEDFEKLTKAINGSEGAARNMANVKMDTLEGSILYLQSAVEGVQIAVGERIGPLFRGIIDGVTAAMPTIQSGIENAIGWIETKAQKYQNIIKQFTNSEEWQNADLGGKIKIAWDKLIVNPFSKWMDSKGKKTITGILSGVFSEAGKIMPGGEEAGPLSWLSAGLIVKAADPVIKGVQGVVSALGSISPIAGTVAGAAAVVVGAFAAIRTAIEAYNQEQISGSLESRFGSIQLSAEQAAEAAQGILDAKYLVNVELALGEFQNADKFHEEAQKALENNKPLEWKSSVGIQLTADEQQDYTNNILTFVNGEIHEVERQSFAAHISVMTFFGQSEEGQKLDAQIQSWARADTLELDQLSSDLTTAVDEALTDGILDVDEQRHIQELQEKINAISNKWNAAEGQAELDWINQKYGNLSGKDLTFDSFTEVASALQNQRETAAAETEALQKQFYSMINLWDQEGKLGPENGLLTADQYKEMAGQAVRNQEATDLTTSLDFETNTLQGTYGDKIAANIGAQKANQQMWLETMAQNKDNRSALASNITAGAEAMNAGNGKGLFGKVSDADQAALNEVWEAMKPDADAMSALVDQYVNEGQAIPQQIMDKFNETMEIGAASGDADAAWQVYANSIAQSGDQALMDAVSNMAMSGELPTEFAAAWARATQEITKDPVTLEGLTAEVENPEVTYNKEEWSQKLHEIDDKLGDIGSVNFKSETEVEFSVMVNKGDCLSEIGEAVGVDWHEIAEYNGLEDPYTIYPNTAIRIPKEHISMDTTEVGTSMEEAVKELSGQGTELEVTAAGVNVTIGDVQVDPGQTLANIAAALGTTTQELNAAGITATTITTGATVTIPQELVTVDSTGLQAAIASSASGEEGADGGTVTATSNVTVDAGTVDAGPAYEETKTQTQETYDTPIETTGDADVTLTQDNNADDIYNQTAAEVRSKYQQSPITASATVNVNLNWHLLNPTKSISVTGSGTGSGSLQAQFNAEGSFVDQPILSVIGEDGPEFIIPVGANHRSRGLKLWEDAGEALGVMPFADGGSAGYDEARPIFDTDGSQESQPADGSNSTPVTIQNLTFEVNVDGAGTQDPDELVNAIRENITGMADDIAYILATSLKQAYTNTPKQAWNTGAA